MKYHDFMWKGELASAHGVVVQTQVQYIRPARRQESIVIPGRSGTLTVSEGDLPVYDNIIYSPLCCLRPGFSPLELGAWLDGEGTVVFGSMSGRNYKARIQNQIPFARIDEGMQYMSFSPIFDCQPGAYRTAGADIVLTEPGFVANPGSMHSEPRLTVKGAGAVNLTVGSAVMTINGPAGGWTLVIDSELVDCLSADGAQLMNHLMSGDFPALLPGSNVINWTGTLNKLTIRPRWRDL